MAIFYPAFAIEEDLLQLLLQSYSIDDIELFKPLNGFDSVNYHVKTRKSYFDDCRNFLLKIGPCTDPDHVSEIFHAQINLMRFLYQKVPSITQRVFNSVDGKTVIKTMVACKNPKNEGKHFHNVTLIEFIEATPMIEMIPFSLALIENVGEKFARLSVALQKFSSNITKRRDFKWDPKNVIKCESFLYLLSDFGQDERIKKCETFLQRFKKEVFQKIESNCREAVIHSDGNCNNILVNNEK